MQLKNLPFCFISFLFLLVSCSERTDQERSIKDTASLGNYGFFVNEQDQLVIRYKEQYLITVKSVDFNFARSEKWHFIDQTEDTLWLEVKFPAVNFYNKKQKKVDTSSLIKLFVDQGGGLVFYSHAGWEKNYTVHIKHEEGEAYYGLTEPLIYDNSRSPNIAGKVLDIAVQGYAQAYGENFASAYSSLFFSSRGYACFFDTFFEGRFSMGIKGETSIHHRTGNLKWHIFPFKQPVRSLSAYYKVIGQPKRVPIWACGPIIWRDQHYHGRKDVMDDASKFAAMHIPVSAFLIDRPYSNGTNGWSEMDFNMNFKNPDEWIDSLEKVYNTKVMTWISASTFDPDFPGTLPGEYNYLDLTDSSGTQIFVERLQRQHQIGVQGHKMGRGDESFPYFQPWKQETDKFEHRNRYAYLYAKTTDQALRERYGGNQFTFARAAYHRCQPYLSALWGGEVDKSWYGMGNNMANALRCSWMGFPLWGTDVGGYTGDALISDSLYVRWLQWGVFNGMFEIKIDAANDPQFAEGPDRAPWNCSPVVKQGFQKACEERMKWLPYIYSLANTSGKTGPLMQPMAFVYPNDKDLIDTWDQYMFGPALMVAPYFTPGKKRSVQLPSGKWMNLNKTNQRFRGGKTIDVTNDLTTMPLFIKGNSLFLQGNIYNGSKLAFDTSGRDTAYHLEVHAFPGVPGDKKLFTYVDPLDNDEQKNFIMLMANEEVAFQLPAIKYPLQLICYLEEEPSQVEVNGKPASFTWDKKNEVLRLDLPLDKLNDVEIKW